MSSTDYLKQVLQNFKDSMPLFTIIGVLVSMFVAFNGFPEDKLPRFLIHNFLLIYLYIIFSVALIVIIICLLKPIVSAEKFTILWQYHLSANKTLDQSNTPFLLTTLCLIGIGTLIIYSSSLLFAGLKLGNSTSFLKSHIIYVVLGMILLSCSSACFHYSSFQKIATLLIGCNAIFLTLGLAGFQTGIGSRWFVISHFSFNYFEITKIASVIYLAHILSRHRINFFSIIPAGIIFLLVFLLGGKYSLGLIILLLFSIILMIIARFNSLISATFLIGLQFVCLLIFSIPLYKESQQHGGFWGVGFGLSLRYFENFIFPFFNNSALQFEVFSDLTFQILTKEFGVIGIILTVILFLSYTFGALTIALRATDVFGRLLVFGIVGFITLQAFLNIGTSLKVMPIIEISLPFFSYGSFQTLANMLLTGVILNVARSTPIQEKEKKEGLKEDIVAIPSKTLTTGLTELQMKILKEFLDRGDYDTLNVSKALINDFRQLKILGLLQWASEEEKEKQFTLKDFGITEEGKSKIFNA